MSQRELARGLSRIATRTSNSSTEPWDCFRTRLWKHDDGAERKAQRKLLLFPFFYCSPGNPMSPKRLWPRSRLPPFRKQPSADIPASSFSLMCCEFVPRSHPSQSARGGNASSPCSGSSRQWRLQHVRSCRSPAAAAHARYLSACGGASGAADAARTSGSWANRADLSTHRFGRRACKRQK